MPLPTCQCNAGLPVQQQLANIYCALYTLNTGGGGPDGGFLTLNGVQTTTNKTLVAPTLTGETTAGRIVATSTTEEHVLVGNYTAAGYTTAGVLLLNHTDPVGGNSAVRFQAPGTANEFGAVGVGGSFNAGLYHCTFLEGSDEQGQSSGLPIRIIQRSTLGGTKAYASAARFEIRATSGGPMSFFSSTGAAQILGFSDGVVQVGTGAAAGGQLRLSGDSGYTTGGAAFYDNQGSPGVAGVIFGAGTGEFWIRGGSSHGVGFINSAGTIQTGFISETGDFESNVVGSGFILKSPNGTRYRIAVSNAGALSAAPA